MEPVDEDGEELVRVLLLVAAERRLVAADGVLEVFGRDGAVLAAPERLEDGGQLFGDVAARALGRPLQKVPGQRQQ